MNKLAEINLDLIHKAFNVLKDQNTEPKELWVTEAIAKRMGPEHHQWLREKGMIAVVYPDRMPKS